ncbi:MAG: DNA primase [Actinobacteria bacterium]|nr:DNA primase [Actinomycetota bacterium]
MAGRISRGTVERVRERADLVEMVQARTGQVRMTGGRAMARCPFHEERTASFSIEPTQKLYHCFGCGVSGDVFKLVMELEACEFPEAVERLAERYGVPIEYDELSPREAEERDREKRVERLLEETCAFYERVLLDSPEAEAARAYLAERHLDAAAVAHWRIGWAPDAWERVVGGARGKGYTDEELMASGVASEGRRGPIDRLRGRLVFPLADGRGRVRGFAGRILPGQEGPKYINSPEGPLFHKGRMLYGLHHARSAIAKAGRAVIVEGYTDVIALHGAGVQEAVASMGTSLTEEQLAELRRLCSALVLAFDADQAGQEAALRGMRLAEQQGFDVRIVPLPPGQDPAEIAQGGREAVDRAFDGAVSVLAFLVGRALARRDEDGSDRVYAELRSILSQAPPTPERQAQVRRVADQLRLDAELEARLTRGARVGQPAADDRTLARARRRLDQRARAERELLAACLAQPALAAASLDEAGPCIADPTHQALVGWVRERAAGAEPATPPGAEDVVAELYALAGRYDPEGGEIRTPGEGQVALRQLVLQLRLRAADDAIGPLRVKVEDGSADQDEQRALLALQREAEALRAELRATGAIA